MISLEKCKVICPLLDFQISVSLKEPFERGREEKNDYFKKSGEQLVEGIELVDGVRIRCISKEDVGDIKRHLSLWSNMMDLSSVRFVLAKNDVENREFQTTKVMHRIVLGMRLFKSGYVSGNFVFYIPRSEEGPAVDWSREEGQKRERYGLGYTLNFDEISALKNLLEQLFRFDFEEDRRLDLAFKRFGRAYEEDDSEDQLIDLVIALEALFTKKKTKKIGKKIAQECSALLGKDDQERNAIYGHLVEAYGIRNSIVHGSEYSKSESSEQMEADFDFMENIVHDMEGFVRDSIKAIVYRQ